MSTSSLMVERIFLLLFDPSLLVGRKDTKKVREEEKNETRMDTIRKLMTMGKRIGQEKNSKRISKKKRAR